MQTIQIRIEAFGAIERLLPNHLSITCTSPMNVEDVLHRVVTLHPVTIKAMERCACAIGDNMVTRKTPLRSSCTLVLLSPVAGG